MGQWVIIVGQMGRHKLTGRSSHESIGDPSIFNKACQRMYFNGCHSLAQEHRPCGLPINLFRHCPLLGYINNPHSKVAWSNDRSRAEALAKYWPVYVLDWKFRLKCAQMCVWPIYTKQRWPSLGLAYFWHFLVVEVLYFNSVLFVFYTAKRSALLVG